MFPFSGNDSGPHSFWGMARGLDNPAWMIDVQNEHISNIFASQKVTLESEEFIKFIL